MKIAVCEDEAVYSDKLYGNILKYFENRSIHAEISVFTDGEPLTAAYKSGESFDLIFLDIQLENSDGMDIGAQIRRFDSNSVIIFVTSFENRAVEGYSVSAFDYIVKSSLDDRLNGVLDRYMHHIGNSTVTFQSVDGDTVVIPFADIICAESDGRGTIISTHETDIKSSVPIGKLSSLLPQDKFTEIHKSIFVQTSKIKRIGSDSVEMNSGKILPMSRRKRKSVLSAVMRNMKGEER